MTPPGDRSDAALETEIQRLADLLSFGDRRNFRGRCAPADQGLLALRVEEVQVVGVDRHLKVLPGLDVAAARVHASGQRLAADVQVDENLAAHALDDFDFAVDLGQAVASGEANVLDVLRPPAHNDLLAPGGPIV